MSQPLDELIATTLQKPCPLEGMCRCGMLWHRWDRWEADGAPDLPEDQFDEAAVELQTIIHCLGTEKRWKIATLIQLLRPMFSKAFG